jgi:hypothetical protein
LSAIITRAAAADKTRQLKEKINNHHSLITTYIYYRTCLLHLQEKDLNEESDLNCPIFNYKTTVVVFVRIVLIMTMMRTIGQEGCGEDGKKGDYWI